MHFIIIDTIFFSWLVQISNRCHSPLIDGAKKKNILACLCLWARQITFLIISLLPSTNHHSFLQSNWIRIALFVVSEDSLFSKHRVEPWSDYLWYMLQTVVIASSLSFLSRHLYSGSLHHRGWTLFKLSETDAHIICMFSAFMNYLRVFYSKNTCQVPYDADDLCIYLR